MDTTNPTISDIVIVWDKSGSMAVMKNEPVEAINAFIEGQRNNDDGVKVSFVQFNDEIETVFSDLPLREVKNIRLEDYKPDGMTALYDAIGFTFTKKLESTGRTDNVIAVIMTDGKENCSSKYNISDVKELIERVESKHSWKVVFLGANLDVEKEGSKMNIDRSRTSDYDQNIPGCLLNLCRNTSSAISNFRRCVSEGKAPDLNIRACSEPVTGMEKKNILSDPHRFPSNSKKGFYDTPYGIRSIEQSPIYKSTPPKLNPPSPKYFKV